MPNFFDTAAGGAVLGIGQQAIGGAMGAGLGLLLQNQQDKRQLRQQGKLQALEIQGQQQMTDYNMKKQMEMWENTNYSAQAQQMRKAGLNPGLMYGMGGGGATTTDVKTGNVTGAHAPTGGGEIQAMTGMGMQLGMQSAQLDLMKAQAENLRADAANKRTENPNIALTGQEILQRIASSQQQQEYTKAMTAFKELETKFASETFETRKQQLGATLDDTIAKITQIGLANNWTKETWDIAKQQLTENLANTQAHNALLEVQKRAAEKGINLTEQQITTLKEQVAQGWQKLFLEEQQGFREDIKLKQSELQLLYNEMKVKFDIAHPGLWNVVGGTLEETIQQTVEDIKGKLRRLIPRP